MAKQAEITYLFNSGFAVRLGGQALIFDYFQDEAQCVPTILARSKRTYFFCSHAHFDHLSPRLAEFSADTTRYFMSFDTRSESAARRLPSEKVTYLNAYDSFCDANIKVTTYSSTDEGVSFLAEIDGWKIFHAGDFNWWHWKGDSAENRQLAKNAFMKQMKKLDGLQADIAFFPVDKRLEEFCAAGALEFCRRTEVRHLVAMHNTLHSPWQVPENFPSADRLISVWTPETPGDEIRIIR